MAVTNRSAALRRRHARVRKHLRGTIQRPRLAVYRSNTGIYAQVIDDLAGRTLAAASHLDHRVAQIAGGKAGMAAAVGKLLAERARQLGIERVVFDRGGNRYHGRVKALADAARQGGLEF
ncbi:MAG: 50S ribosomal protein L18 [Pseudonocardiaceae bacterium]